MVRCSDPRRGTRRPRHARRLAAALLVLTAIVFSQAGASTGTLRFYPDDPLWREPETQDASGVAERSVDLTFDVVENLFVRPGDPRPSVRARNVNTVDEVPNSSWFTNRIGSRPVSAAEVRRGPDTTDGPAPGRWTIVSAKSDGITPGFTIEDEEGTLWFLKFDPPGYRAMATGTEVTVTKLLWALGYFVPENRIATLDRHDLAVGEGATVTPPGGRERRMTPADIDRLLEGVSREPDGTFRVVASRAVPGRPVGPFRFYGTRSDDPNDVIPHEHRRELRALRVFAAWLNQVDSKSVNSLDTVVAQGDRALVRHYLIDFGSALGSAAVWPREPWEGYEHLVETPGNIGRRIVGFGFAVPFWRSMEFFERPSIGRLPRNHRRWDPEQWRPRLPNPAFRRARADDRFWAARRVMALSDGHLRAAIQAGRFEDPEGEAFLLQALRERRDAIGRTYLPAINPVTDPHLDRNGALTFANAAVEHDVERPPEAYRAVWYSFNNATGASGRIGETRAFRRRLPAPGALPAGEGAFVQVEVSAVDAPRSSWERPVTLVFRRQERGWAHVGLVRQPDGAPDPPFR